MGTSDPKNGGAPPEAEGFRVEDRRVSTNPDRAEEAPEAAVEDPSCACGASANEECSHEEGAPGQIDPPTFAQFVVSLYHTALYHFGLVPGPEGDKPPCNLALARENIAIIEMLDEKTKGNLDAQEERLIKQVLYELRMTFMKLSGEHQKE